MYFGRRWLHNNNNTYELQFEIKINIILKNYVFLYPVYSLLSAVFLHWRMSFLSVPNAKHRLISRN